MQIVKNESNFDRILRVIISVVLFLWSYYWLSGWAAAVVYVLAAVALLTAITGFCGLYKLFGISTIGQQNKMMK
jgi:hypothetical protein